MTRGEPLRRPARASEGGSCSSLRVTPTVAGGAVTPGLVGADADGGAVVAGRLSVVIVLVTVADEPPHPAVAPAVSASAATAAASGRRLMRSPPGPR